MSNAELLIWSATAGAIGLIVILALVNAAFSRSVAALQTLAYMTGFWVFVMLLCGLAEVIWPAIKPVLPAAQILIGPLCAALGSYGCSQWLSAHKRDQLMRTSLQGLMLASLVGGPLCLLLPSAWGLPASAALSVVNMTAVLLLSVYAAQLGDRLAWGLAAGCLLSLPLQIGLYAMALESSHPSLLVQAGVALAGLSSGLSTTLVLWLRNRHTQRLDETQLSQRDPITQLHSSTAMVQKIIQAQGRRVHTRRDGALMAVMMFHPERLLAQVGEAGLNDIYIQMAHRMQRHTGVVNPAGRYYDRCFVVLIETLHSPRLISTLGLRVASSLRQPLEVISMAGQRTSLTVDIAVGVVHMAASGKTVDQLLHEVQQVAQAARGMRSRAALLDPQTRQAVPLETADLGDSWRDMRQQNTSVGKPKKIVRPGAARVKPVRGKLG